MSGEISFSGLASGIDFDEMISKLIEAEKYQVNKLESWKEEWENKVTTIQDVNTKMSSVLNSIEALRNPSTFYSRLSSSSNNLVAEIAVDSSAEPAAYNLEVATSSKHIVAGRGWADRSLTVVSNNGTLEFSDGEGNNIVVNVNNTMTMNDLQTAINTELSNAGSNATTEIFSDGSSSNEFRLKITSGAAGSDGEIVFTNDDTSLNFTSTFIDDIEETDWNGTASLSSGGTYTGHVNKRLNFEVLSGGTVGSDDIEIKWSDSVENRSGTVTIDAAGSFTILQGIDINIGAGTITKGDTFALDVSNPTLQEAQDSGLAYAEKETHSGFSDMNSTAITTVDGTFAYSFAGETITPIQVSAGTTLQGLADLINDDPANPGVEATIVNDGTGLPNSYHLMLTSEKTGAANKIENITHTLDNFSSDFEETQKGTNSLIRLNGYPSDDEYIQSSSNLISDLIDGASITLNSEGTTKFNITNDVDAMTDKVKDFVDAYNESMDYLNEITKVVLDEEDVSNTDEAGIFVGNYTIQIIQSELQSFVTDKAVGFEDGVDDFILLKQVGFSFDDDRKLEFDEDLFKEKLRSDPDEVVNLFADDKAGESSNSYIKYLSGTGLTQEGKYVLEANFDGTGTLTGGRYRDEDGSTWYSMTAGDNNTLTAMEGDAIGMAVQANWDGSSTTQNSTIRIKMGKANEYYYRMRDLMSESTGITKVLEDNYENIITNIDKRIERELRRVVQVQTRLKERYANLEVTLQSYNSQMERVQQQIGSLPTSV